MLPIALLGLAACASTLPNRDPRGERFPSLRARTLASNETRLPDDLRGAPAILLVGYVMDAQFDIDRWLLGLLQVENPVRRLELPTIDGMLPGLFAGAIDAGMRGGIPSEDWAAVATVYGSDAARVVRFTGEERPRNARVLLLDAEGRVRWFHDRGFAPAALLDLDRLARELASGASEGHEKSPVSRAALPPPSEDRSMSARVLFDFQTTDSDRGWRTVDDVVMGGVSRSTFTCAEPGVGVFAGELSLENNGGFASLRSPDMQTDLAGCDGLELEVRGDGRQYKLNLRLESEFDGVVYQSAFDAPAATWTRVRVPFRELEPTFRGRRVLDAPAFDPKRVTSVGLILADERAGPFRLELRRIAAWRANG